MKDLIEYILKLIPSYLQSVGSLAISPRRFWTRRELLEDDIWSSSLIFFCISMIVGFVLSSLSILSPADPNFQDAVVYIIERAIEVLVASTIFFIAWRMIAGAMKFETSVMFCLYIYGMNELAVASVGLVLIGLVRAKDQELFAELAAMRADDGIVKINSTFFFDFDAHPVLVYLVAAVVVLTLVKYAWYWFAWLGVSDALSVTWRKAFLAFVAAGVANILFNIFFPFIDYAI